MNPDIFVIHFVLHSSFDSMKHPQKYHTIPAEVLQNDSKALLRNIWTAIKVKLVDGQQACGGSWKFSLLHLKLHYITISNFLLTKNHNDQPENTPYSVFLIMEGWVGLFLM